jgi:hypothetical protein
MIATTYTILVTTTGAPDPVSTTDYLASKLTAACILGATVLPGDLTFRGSPHGSPLDTVRRLHQGLREGRTQTEMGLLDIATELEDQDQAVLAERLRDLVAGMIEERRL